MRSIIKLKTSYIMACLESEPRIPLCLTSGWVIIILGKPVLGQLVDDYLMDFDIFHVSAVSELAHYVETKYLCTELGGSAVTDVDQWLLVQVRGCLWLSSYKLMLPSPQENVDSFTVSATKCARRMATFVKILNKEDISTIEDRESIREVSTYHISL